MELKPGDKFGDRYQLLSKLGEGGMGEVWKARDTRLDRDVALKVSKAEFTARFDREARAIAAFNHPNICTLYDVGPNYIVMEWIDGVLLQGPLPVEKAVAYAGFILDALDAAHRKGFTHRDLKPANVIVMKSGILKLLDFGLAKQSATGLGPDDETGAARTKDGQITGTLQYMSPEQLHGKEADVRSDIFAFGCVLYEMLSGRKAFSGSTTASVIAAIMEREPEPLQTTPPLDRIIRTCVAKDPDQRIQTARDAKTVLLWAMESGPASSAPPRSRFGSSAWLIVAAAMLALSMAIALWAPWRDTKPTDQPLVRLDVDLGAGVDIVTSPGGGSRIIISPDGGRLVYMSYSRLFTRRLDQASSTELKGAEGASAPFFSPDGKWVAFTASGKLKKISVDGGAAVAICDAAGGSGSWGDDGNIIFASAGQAGLSKVPASGGTPVPVTKLAQGEITHRWPQVLPDSKAVLFTSNSGFNDGFDAASIEVVSLKDGRRKTLQRGGTYGRYIPAASGLGHLIYANQQTLFAVPFDLDKLEVRGTPVPVAQQVATGTGGAAQLDFSRAGTLVYVTGGLDGLLAIQWLGTADKAPPLPAKPGVYKQMRLSPDGQKLALTVIAGSSVDIWIYEWQRDTMTRLTFGGRNDYPVWSPDGRYIVFQTSAGMFWTRADGGGKPQPLTQSKQLQTPSSFAPDGKRLLFYENTGGPGENDLWTVAVESGQTGSNGAALLAGKPEVFLQTSFDESRGVFSPDGHWLAYRSNESGKEEVYVRAFPDSGGRWQISNGGGDEPRWSRSSHELIFKSDQDLMTASYTVKGDSFVPEKARVWLAGQINSIRNFRDFDVMPDGKRVVVLERLNAPGDQSPSHVTFLLNFADELRRRSK